MLKITATELPRFMACNGSRLMESLPPVNPDDTVRNEGDAADWLIAQVFAGRHLPEELVDRKAENGVYITDDMVEHISEYMEWIAGRGEIERDCSHGGENWQIAGRTDHVWFDAPNETLYVSDFKYGWKIIEPDMNWTLLSHAIGFCNQTGAYPKRIVLKIFQPRPYHPRGNVRAFELDRLHFYNKVIPQLNQTMSNPTDKLQTSPQCYKCPRMSMCPAAQVAGMNAIDVAYSAFKSDVGNDDLEFLLEQTKRAMEILKQNHDAYEELTMSKLKSGQQFKNYNVQIDVGRETWRDDVTPEFVESITGKKVTKKQLLTPKQIEKLGVSRDVIKLFTTRPNKGIKLVKVDSNTRAEELFNRN